VKPRHDLRHRQRGVDCGIERGSRGIDERSFDSSACKPGWQLEPVWDNESEGDDATAVAVSPAPERPDPHGRTATHPQEIPKRGWRDILVRVRQNLGRDNTSVVAAGIGLHALLAVFPLLAVIVSVYGMFASPESVAGDVQPFLAVFPPSAAKLLTAQLQSLAATKNHTLGFGAVAATLLALWNSRKGVGALMTATNIAYKEPERRGFLLKLALSVVFSLSAIVIFAAMLLVGVSVPTLLRGASLGGAATDAVLVFRWVLLWSFAVLGLSLAYRYAPDRQKPKWRWVTWGSVIAASVWILGSLAFSLYVQNFGSYSQTYGTLGGVIVLLMWFYLMGFTIVLGAEINAEMEHQTAADTTEGPPAPMGKRGAYVADTLGRASK
jgi:membrane protein